MQKYICQIFFLKTNKNVNAWHVCILFSQDLYLGRMIGHIVCGHTIRHVTGQSMPYKSLQNIAQAQILASSSIQTVVVVTSLRGKKIHYALCSIKAATNQQHNIKVHSYTGTIIVIKNFFKTFCA